MLKIAEKEDVPVAAELAGMLWPHHSREELEGELLSFIESGGMVFLWMEEGSRGQIKINKNIKYYKNVKK